jgi:tetratricopeptide (TPR) repeat protein
MRKLFLLIVCLLGCSVVTNAQVTRQQAREAEWKSYSLPQTNFARQLSGNKELLFRIPADWKQEGTEFIFRGPHSATIQVSVSKIPDGYPFQEYFASTVQAIRDVPGAAETILTRKTQLQDLEAREIFLEMPDAEGEMLRRIVWITVSGPLAIAFHFQVPPAYAAETEPYFKAVVQSVIFVSNDYPAFETLRASTIKTPTPGPIHEIESIVAGLNDANPNRDSAVTRLASLFSSHADVAVDLLLDRRPMVRAAAVQALARTNNSALTPFLWEMVDDEELLVAEAAARSVAISPDVVAKTLKHSQSGFNTETVARIWPFMTKEKRIELLQRIFNQPVVRPARPTPPSKTPAKSGVKVVVTELVPVKPGMPTPDISVGVSTDPNVQIGALTLLSSITPEEFKLPLTRIMASNYDPLIAVGLQVANDRAESLPLEALFKLVASSNQQVSERAAQSFGLSAGVSDIPRVEALISKDASGAKKTLNDQLNISIKKIRFRHELGTAKSPAESREIIRKALSDSSLADFAWRYDCEATVSGCAQAGTQSGLKRDFAVKPFAENLFPQRVRHYAAIPNPGQAVQEFYETLNGLQMDSPRAQANLVLTMGYIRQTLANKLSAPADATTLIEYTGIDANSPIALSAWTAPGALDRTNSAQRKAIVLRVKDRARFERTLEHFQKSNGSFTNLTDYLAIGTRVIAALPAILPLGAQAVRSSDPNKPSTEPLLKFGFITDKEWNGLRIKTIEHRWINSGWAIESAATHLAFVGDTVILTPDLATIRDLLTNVNNPTDRQYLADNAEFRKAIQLSGDIVYFSDVEAVLAELAAITKDTDFKVSESGALNISSASWENSHHLVFEESDWAKPLLPFHPKEMTAPRELLPASTIAYYLMKVDIQAFWPTKLRTLFIRDDLPPSTNVWSLDFKKEILPELGPECGAVILDLTEEKELDGTWAVFCKLKSNKLADALSAGKLFTGVGPTKGFAEVKIGANSYFVATRGGFLVVSNRDKGIAALDGKSNLASTRDYSRAVDKVQGGIVAFGGYNLEAAIAAANKLPADGLERAQTEIASIITSVASAFHSQNFFATATAGTIEAKSSVAMDREGRYPVADFSLLPRGTNITFVTLEPGGVPITDQKRLSSLVLRVRAKAPGPIDNIRDDIKSAEQIVEQKSAKELLVTVAARRGGEAQKAIELPVKDPAFAEYLKSSSEFAADQQVKDQARQIAGDDRDAWSVAHKLADWTHKNLEWKHVANANAAQTFATREADCSEFSALFVAMARSLGLPSRMVSGLAYSGNSFGGHAWVEVWVGKWIELDPTWGTDFVDATHIRNSSNNALVTSAALNLIELEVVETRRNVEDFQKSSKALTQHLLKAIPLGDQSDIEAAIDLPILTDEFMGEGAWSKMNDGERAQMWSAYRRVLTEIISYGKDVSSLPKVRLLYIEEKGNVAEATCLLAPFDTMLKLRLVRRNDLWYFIDLVQTDVGLRSAYEVLQHTIAAIERTRSGQKTAPSIVSDFVRVILLLNSDPAKAVAVADEALKIKPADQRLRYLKAVALFNLDKEDEAIQLLKELANEHFPPALNKLADHWSESENKKKSEDAILLYERYTSLQPRDPRGFRDLAFAYSSAGDPVKAEAAYRKVIELNPTDSVGYLDCMLFLVMWDRLPEVKAVLLAADKNKDTDEDLFGSALESLYLASEPEHAEKLAASEPSKMKVSHTGNLILGKIHLDNEKYAAALNFLNISAQLEKTCADPYVTMAMVHRKQSRWNAALKATEQAISLNRENSEAYYQRACALARLGRIKEAMSALEKAVELAPDQVVVWIANEKDLKPLASLPAFKKLLPEPEKP